jgi:hypothetical protein
VNVYEIAINKIARDREEEKRRLELERLEWERRIDSLIYELPALIPDGLDWLWDYQSGYYFPDRLRESPRINLSVSGEELELVIKPVWDNGKLSLLIFGGDEERYYVTDPNDPGWTLDGFIWTEIYYAVKKSEDKKEVTAQ